MQAVSIDFRGDHITWADQCVRIGPDCDISYVTEMFAAPADYDTTAKILAKLNTLPAPISVVTGQPVFLDSILGREVQIMRFFAQNAGLPA